MARLRNWTCYRGYKRAYTRYSKYKKLCYVRARPANRLSRHTGGTQSNFQFNVHLVPKTALQIRDAALESARQACNRTLELVLGKTGYFIQVRTYPHHILRENPLAAGAGADRLSTGMAHNYGKPIGIAAQVKKNQPIFTVKTNKENLTLAREAMYRAAYKLPCTCQVIVEEIAKKRKLVSPKDSVKKASAKKTATA